MNLPLFKVFTLLFAVVLSVNAYAQKQSLIGLNVNSDVYPDEFRPSVGVTYEKQILKHSGFETGLFYRTSQLDGTVILINPSGFTSSSFAIAQRFLTVPVLYKYYSKFLDFSAGPVVGFYLGWKEKNTGSIAHTTNFQVGRKVNFGFLVKAGKLIPLSKQFFVEPELRFGSVYKFDEINLGIGIAGNIDSNFLQA